MLKATLLDSKPLTLCCILCDTEKSEPDPAEGIREDSMEEVAFDLGHSCWNVSKI